MRLRDLPGYPSPYVELAESSLKTPEALRLRASEAASAAAPRKELGAALAREAERVHSGPNTGRSLSAVEQPGSLLVAAEVLPAAFGGPLAQVLACLTAVRITRDLTSEGFAAVPIVCVDSRFPPGREVHVLDSNGRIVDLSAGTSDSTPDFGGCIERVAALYASNQIEPESLRLLERAYGDAVPEAAATLRLLAELLEPWGALVAESSNPAMAESRPIVVARVVGPVSIMGLSPGERGSPLLWPALSATLVDARSRMTMERYGLALADLFEGAEALLERVADLGAGSVLQRFREAEGRIEAGLSGLASRVPAEDALHRAIGEAQGRMKYQLEKLKERYSAAVVARREAAARQLEKLCISLAPGGRPQELYLAGIHFVLRYSRAVLPEIMDKMDPYNSEHQQIALE